MAVVGWLDPLHRLHPVAWFHPVSHLSLSRSVQVRSQTEMPTARRPIHNGATMIACRASASAGIELVAGAKSSMRLLPWVMWQSPSANKPKRPLFSRARGKENRSP